MTEYKANGVVALLTAPDGRVLATASNFDPSGYGGFKLHEAQKIRARDAMRREFFALFCHRDVAGAIESYHADTIIRSICDQKKYREQFVIVGHDGVDVDEYDYVNRRT
ncbi:MAG: hypothetical protein P4L82_12160 [Ancalomicrobiaceae bacterium]|nr:hypothetical protein [Ancalomicrobiaceae bacterium]